MDSKRNMKAKFIMCFTVVCIAMAFFACDYYDYVDPEVFDYEYSDVTAYTDITYAPDGKGYLTNNSDGKKFLHVEGSAYEMGYQHGYLCAESVGSMASPDFWGALFLHTLGMYGAIEVDDLIQLIGGEPMVRSLIDILYIPVEESIRNGEIPEEFLEEVQGIVDGANDAGVDVDFKSVMMNNMAYDAILALAYPVITPFVPLSNLVMEAPIEPHSCSAFVASGNATADGSTLMGRDFQFQTGMMHKYIMTIEHVPDTGNRFISIDAPSFVGVTAGMNEKGIGVGVDMVPSMNTNILDIGMGALLQNRKVLQYANELSEGVNMYLNDELGVPWIFPIGDGLGAERGGAVVEVTAHLKRVRYSDYRQPWMPHLIVPDQIEKKDDLVITTNYFLIPEMYLSITAGAQDDFKWRYETLTDIALNQYGKLDQERGRMMIDFLHPPNYGYYEPDPDLPVGASVTLFDLTNLEVYSLYGLYSDPWSVFKF